MQKFSNFNDLGKHLGHHINETGKGRNKMTATAHSKPLAELAAVTKYFNHNKRYGFVFVTIPEGTELDYDIVTSERDGSPGAVYTKGEVLDRDAVIEAFIHGSVIERVGYDMGLEENQPLVVKIALNDKGIQVVWTQNKDGSRQRQVNEARKANSYLAFVPGTVKVYHPERNFGFLIVSNDPETGEPLVDERGNAVTREVHFTKLTLTRAGYTHLKEGQVVPVRYWTYSNGRSSVSQFKFPDENTDPETVDPKNFQSRDADQSRAA